MARKAVRVESQALGLRKMKRPSGRVDCYWVATPEMVKLGYPIRTRRVHGNPSDPEDWERMERTCRRLQDEMLAWGRGERGVSGRSARGSLAWLCEAFELDKGSRFHEMRASTQAFYWRNMKTLKEEVGLTRLHTISGAIVRVWHKGWKAKYGERQAYACVQTLRRVVSYGVEIATRPDDPALFLMQALARTTFQVPKGRRKRATYAHVSAFRPAAVAAGRFSMALAVSLQFDLGLRQRDVIGEWIKAPLKTPGLRDGRWLWQWGLTWDQIDKNWILRKPTSKSNGSQIAEHDLNAYPETLALLQSVPKEKRIGPVVIDEGAHRPYRANFFNVKFREIARTCGWPDDVWNMDCRAGAVSEAFEAGAAPADVMKAATHTQMSTTMGYNRGGVVQSSRVAGLRVARRKKPAGGEDAA